MAGAGESVEGDSKALYDFNQDWEEYHAHRPTYPESMYKQVFDYHEIHSRPLSSSSSPSVPSSPGSDSLFFPWGRAADLGCGGGVVAAKLLTRFRRVLASDPSSSHIEFARGMLLRVAKSLNSSSSSLPPASPPKLESVPISAPRMISADIDPSSRLSFVVSKAETLLEKADKQDCVTKVEPGTFDMVCMAEALHWCDTDVALDTIVKMLRPGGTFAMWWYSPLPQLDKIDDEAEDEGSFREESKGDGSGGKGNVNDARAVLEEIYEEWRGLIAPSIGEGMRPSRVCNSSFRCLHFDVSSWEPCVQRHSWVPLDMRGRESGFDVGIEPDRVEQKDHMVDHVAAGETSPVRRSGVDAGWIAQYVHSLWQKHNINDRPSMKEKYARLELALGGQGKTVTLTWPFVLTLASKRKAVM